MTIFHQPRLPGFPPDVIRITVQRMWGGDYMVTWVPVWHAQEGSDMRPAEYVERLTRPEAVDVVFAVTAGLLEV